MRPVMPRRHDLELFLQQQELFRRLSSADRARVAALAHERRLAKGEMVFREGAPSDSIWLVKTGRVHLLHYETGGHARTTCVMTPGETFCCLPALDRGQYPATAVAAADSVVLQIPTPLFHELLRAAPGLLEETLCVFCHRLRQVEATGCRVFEPVDRRIAQALLTLRTKFGDTIPMTRQEIAELSGTTVETSIRTIRRFQQAGWVRATRGQIRLRQPERLRHALA